MGFFNLLMIRRSHFNRLNNRAMGQLNQPRASVRTAPGVVAKEAAKPQQYAPPASLGHGRHASAQDHGRHCKERLTYETATRRRGG